MNGFLKALRDDLLDRRMRLPAALAAVVAVAGIAYAASGSSSSPGGEGAGGLAGRAAAVPTKPPSALEAASLSEKETTYGSGREPASPRDPFRYPSPAGGTQTTPAAGGAGGVAGTVSAPSHPAPSPAGSGGGRTVTQTSTTSTGRPPAANPAPLGVAYVRFGRKGQRRAIAVKVGQALTALGGKLVLAAVRVGRGKGKGSALFRFSGEGGLVSGAGRCVPSVQNCQAVALAEGQTARLFYLGEGGRAVTFLLTLRRVGQ